MLMIPYRFKKKTRISQPILKLLQYRMFSITVRNFCSDSAHQRVKVSCTTINTLLNADPGRCQLESSIK